MTSDGHGTARRLHHLVVAMLLLAVGACASQPPDVPRQYLDQQSAATVTVATGALVFARERPELAVHARDYLTLVPVDVNQAGTHRLYFYCHVWSTIDKRGQPGNDDGPAGSNWWQTGGRFRSYRSTPASANWASPSPRCAHPPRPHGC